MNEGYLPETTLRVFIEHKRLDASLRQAMQQQVSFWQVGGSAEANHKFKYSYDSLPQKVQRT